jgi:hypothetical protein
MTRRFRLWLVVATLGTLANVAGGVMAVVSGEALHAGVHAGLALLGAYAIRRLAPQRLASN